VPTSSRMRGSSAPPKRWSTRFLLAMAAVGIATVSGLIVAAVVAAGNQNQNANIPASQALADSKPPTRAPTGKPTGTVTLQGTKVPTAAPAIENVSAVNSKAPATISSNPPTTTTTTTPSVAPPTPLLTTVGSFELLETVPHDSDAFTQGLQLVNGTLYEGTGLYGESEMRIVDLQTGAVLDRHVMDGQYFGEGISYYADETTGQGKLIQLTWKEQTGFLYDPATLEATGNFTYETTTTQGWGISYRPASHEFLVSDGSQYIHTWDASTLQETTQKVPVTVLREGMLQASTVRQINELEWDPFTDTLLANVWFRDVILRINVQTGFVTKIYDLGSLFTNRPASADVLNGIAVTEVPNELWVTGKLWPSMFRIRLID